MDEEYPQHVFDITRYVNEPIVSIEPQLWLSIEALASAINERVGVPGHSKRTAEYAVDIASELGFMREKIDEIRLGAYIHDIGQIIYPDWLLNLPSGQSLSAEGRKIIESHTTRGIDFIAEYPELQFLIPYIRDHQEKFNRTGYIRGIGGEEISLEVQIISFADQYEANRFPRAFQVRGGRTHEETISILKAGKERWDPLHFEEFLKIAERWKYWE